MNDARRDRIGKEIDALESEYRTRLIAALKACAAGNWGLFGQNDHLDGASGVRSALYERSGAHELDALAAEIEALRHKAERFDGFPLHARFLAERGRKDGNVPGESNRAQAWLDELTR